MAPNGRLQPVKMSPAKQRDHHHGKMRKYTSMTYLSGKLRRLFKRQDSDKDDRETIVCEEDAEESYRRRNLYEIIRCDELMDVDCNGYALARFVTTSSTVSCVSTAPSSVAGSEPQADIYEPSKEQRWCTNCSKCFQRRLSHYDQFCGLDCKTAYRFRC